jgi:hypothetical protein
VLSWTNAVLLIANAAMGLGIGLLMARALRGLSSGWSFARCLAVMFGVYLLECISIAAGRLIPVFSLALALIWGIVFGKWLLGRGTMREQMGFAGKLSAYTCVPWATFLAIPCVFVLTGRSILDTGEAIKFGIPNFVPWPANTILGFFLCLVIVVSILKICITVGVVWLYVRPEGASSADNGGI